MAWGATKCRSAIVIQCGEECDIDCAPMFQGMISQILERGHANIVLDLTDVEYIDSKFLGVLAGSLKLVRAAGGNIQTSCAKFHIRELFETIRYDTLFCIYPTVEEAAISFEPKSERPILETPPDESDEPHEEPDDQQDASGDVQWDPDDQADDSED